MPAIQSAINLQNHFLIAMPNLHDPNFQQTVTYICQHDAEGAIGLILTRAIDLTLGDLLAQLDIGIHHGAHDSAVLSGGPVAPQSGFILHRPLGNWDTTLAVTDEIGLTTSRDILDAIGQGRGPTDVIVALGYAGWGRNQLETELASNSWLTLPAEENMIFQIPPDRLWHAAAKSLGVDLRLLSSDAGHA
jgi:putative transcriptional regulator